MSVCSCDYGGDSVLGCRVSKPQTARKPGHACPLCCALVEPGETCIDAAGLFDDGGGFFHRFHAECFELMVRFREALCGYGAEDFSKYWMLEWSLPFDMDEAAKHAVAYAHEPYWRDWLERFEVIWARMPEPSDPSPNPPMWSRPDRRHQVTMIRDANGRRRAHWKPMEPRS